MTFHPPAWHTPPNGHAGVIRHVPRGREHDITIRTGATAVPPSDLCGAVSRRDRCGRSTSGRSRGAYHLGAGNNVPHPGGSAGILRAYVSRARGRGARGVLESRVRKAQPSPTCVLVGRGRGFFGAALLPRRGRTHALREAYRPKERAGNRTFPGHPSPAHLPSGVSLMAFVSLTAICRYGNSLPAARRLCLEASRPLTAMSQPHDHREHRRYFAASLQVYFRYAVPTSGMLSVSGTHGAG